MPEGPEVDTLRRQLSPFLPAVISKAQVSHPRSVRNTSVDLDLLSDSAIVSVSRFGKWLFLGVSPGPPLQHASVQGATWHLWVHLRMSGRLHLKDPLSSVEKHTHISLFCKSDKSSFRLDFVDPRTFGEVRLSPDPVPSGHDVASPLSYASLPQKLRLSTKPVKALLLDQKAVVSGVGNYLADEVCHRAKISPLRPMSEVSESDFEVLSASWVSCFADFTSLRGTALQDEGWRDLFGSLGDGSQALKVHARKSCQSCLGPVLRSKVAGRSAYFCPACQS